MATYTTPDRWCGWNFGDNSTRIAFQPPAHTNALRTTQTFSVTFSAQNDCGQQTFPVTLTVLPAALAEIGVDSTNVRCTPVSICFSNRSYDQGVCVDSSDQSDAIRVLAYDAVAPDAFTPNVDGVVDT